MSFVTESGISWNYAFVEVHLSPLEQYVAEQDEWVKQNGIKRGTKLTVTRKATHEENGWPDIWDKGMDDCVNAGGEVHHIDNFGVRLRIDNVTWNFPFFVLQPTVQVLESKPEEKQWRLMGDDEIVDADCRFTAFERDTKSYPLNTFTGGWISMEPHIVNHRKTVGENRKRLGTGFYATHKPLLATPALPKPAEGWEYVKATDVLIQGDKYMDKGGELDRVSSGLGKTIEQLKAGNLWSKDWVGVVRQKQRSITAKAVAELNDLCQTIHSNNKNAGWWDAANNSLVVPTKLALIHSEISEALEGHRKGIKDDKLPQYDMVAVELADALIRIFDLAGFLGIQLGTIIEAKERYNAQRADHKPEVRKGLHGKRY
jgi:NTP pyrophosphatase (non-canonical NTP hydrolase)